jgi:hypothetical protein
MDFEFRQLLLILHFMGLAMGFSVSFANMVIGSMAAKAAPSDRAVMARIPPAMTRVGDIGLVLLLVSGLWMMFSYYGGFDAFSLLGWPFHVKITLVIVLLGLIGFIHSLMRKAQSGDVSAAALIPKVGRVAFLTAVTIVVMAVLAFN